MKNVVYSILLLAATSIGFTACNGDYNANPGSASNGIVNPLDPLAIKDFTWTGTTPLSATINGNSFVADASLTTWSLDTAGGNVITGFKSGTTNGMNLYLRSVYGGNLYGMGSKSYYISATWIDSTGVADSYYYSYLGNSGEVYITENDSAYIKGLFYFEGVSTNGNIVAVNNGYFNIKKP